MSSPLGHVPVHLPSSGRDITAATSPHSRVTSLSADLSSLPQVGLCKVSHCSKCYRTRPAGSRCRLHCQLASPITTPTCHPVISRASHQHVVEAFQALVRAVVNSLLTHLPQPYCVRLCISTSALGVATAHGAGVPWAHRLMHTWRGMRRLLSAYYSILVATPGGPGLLQYSLGMGFDVPCNLAFSSFAWFRTSAARVPQFC